MMFGAKLQIAQLKNKIAYLENALEEQQKHCNVKEQEDRNAKFVIDWSKLDVFSIERQYNYNGNLSVTVIGHWLTVNGTKMSKEWVLYCSVARHNELVDDFIANKGKKK